MNDPVDSKPYKVVFRYAPLAPPSQNEMDLIQNFQANRNKMRNIIENKLIGEFHCRMINNAMVFGLESEIDYNYLIDNGMEHFDGVSLQPFPFIQNNAAYPNNVVNADGNNPIYQNDDDQDLYSDESTDL